jgi:hypothetical protein
VHSLLVEIEHQIGEALVTKLSNHVYNLEWLISPLMEFIMSPKISLLTSFALLACAAQVFCADPIDEGAIGARKDKRDRTKNGILRATTTSWFLTKLALMRLI